jgi:short-subunit dehydrogenase
VTGATRGIGLVTATLLASHGYAVFGTARTPGAVSHGGFDLLPLDVTSDASVQSCVTALLERTGRIDVLVNNAAVGLLGAIEETTIEEARDLFDANLFGTARMVNAVLPGMRQRRHGLIINFGSLAWALPIPFHAYLSASKAAVITYTEALRLEVKHCNIGVTVVEPGMVATHRGATFAQLRVRGVIDDYAADERHALAVVEQGQGAGGDPRDVAETVLRIIHSKAPARYYLVGRERWFVRASRILPPSVIEGLVTRRFGLSR